MELHLPSSTTCTSETTPTAANTGKFTYDLTDKTDTFGVGIKDKGLMDGKLELGGNASIVLASTQYDTKFPAASFNVLPFPEITSDSYVLKFNGRYELDKNSAFKASYVWRKVKSNDWTYDNLTATPTASMVNDNETSPNYTVQFLGISYQRTFW
ncbi:MAG: MtrB/PioB family outer membrane beta-barrel protein [Magnetococcales bacterium]|nr:MtrB/PioB family outer membrane beta-barrel protein [Magnetococcales bacterium]